MEDVMEYLSQFQQYRTDFMEFAKGNPVVGGLVGIWLLGVFTYVFKSLPLKLYHFILRHITVSVTLNNANRSFHNMLEWYEKEKGVTNNRTMRVTNGQWGDGNANLSVGLGDHYFMFRGFPFKLNRSISSQDGEKVKEEISIKTIGLTQKKLIKLIKATLPAERTFIPKIYVTSDHGWERSQTLPERSWDSVILEDGQKERILNFVEEFKESKDWYLKMGVSYKTGILLSGPPGTGKTSVIKALASHLKKNLCVINCSALSDAAFMSLLAGTPKDSLVLMEDFDSLKSLHSREDGVGEPQSLAEGFGISLSGFLNAVDGVFSSDGRILIATSNCIDKLDPAVLRPGRFDLKEFIGYANNEMVEQMFKKFYPDFDTNSRVKIGAEISLAQVENCILVNKKAPEKALEEVLELTKKEVKVISKFIVPMQSDSEVEASLDSLIKKYE